MVLHWEHRKTADPMEATGTAAARRSGDAEASGHGAGRAQWTMDLWLSQALLG